MTEKLYYADSHLCENDAIVFACAPADGGYDVELDKTVLFAEGGGQPCDTGRIGDARVLSVSERKGVILHRTDRPLPVGTTVRVTLDWARRFDHMQQHTGEHMFSFVAFDRFGAVNVGFHMAETYTTVDFDRPLSPEEVAAIERVTNELLVKNLPVRSLLFDSEEALIGLPLRKHAEGLTTPIRIVEIEQADCCTCCAPHCRETGEVGSMLVTEAAAYKGGMRLTILCGARAVAYAHASHATLDRIARKFSTGRDQAEAAVDRLIDECSAAKRREKELTAALNGYVANELVAGAQDVRGAKLITHVFTGWDAARLKQLAPQLLGKRTLAVLFSKLGEQTHYLLAASDDLPLDMGELIQAVNTALSGRGGGRGTRAQGMAKSTPDLTETAEQLTHYFTQRLKK